MRAVLALMDCSGFREDQYVRDSAGRGATQFTWFLAPVLEFMDHV